MKLYIPKHLRKIKVIDQLYLMYSEYITGTDETGKAYYEDYTDSFSDYQNYCATDPVRRFLDNWIDEEVLKEENMDKSTVVSYLVKLFYSLKGTPRVLDYLGTYLGLGVSYNYSTSFLELDIKAGGKVKITDKELFLNDLYNFCSELLYFNNNKSAMDKIKINVVEKVKNVVGSNYIPYSYITATEYKGIKPN